MDVSFIITVYNKEQYLHYCIRSLIKQNIKTNVEYIFVDDCSTDNSVSVIESYTQELNNIRIVQMDRNKGVMAAIYKGIESASGKYIQFLDADDQIAPNAVDYCVNLAKQQGVDFIKQMGERNKHNDSFHLCKPLDITNIEYITTNSPFEYYCANSYLFGGIGMFCEKNLLTVANLTQDIFVQDQYLNNILFLYSKKAIIVKQPIIYCSKVLENAVSSNHLQLSFDRLTCIYHWYIDNKTEFQKKNITGCGSKLIDNRLRIHAKEKLKRKYNKFLVISRIYKIHVKYMRFIRRNNTVDENIIIMRSMIEDMYTTYKAKLRYPKYEN